MKRNAAFCGAICHPLVQHRTPNAVTNAAGKTGPDFLETVDKPDASKRRSISGINANAQCRQRSQAVRHYAFSARLINRWLQAIHDRNLEARLPGSDGGRKSGRTSTRDQDFRFSKIAHITSAVRRVPNRIPDPSRRECCNSRQQDGDDS